LRCCRNKGKLGMEKEKVGKCILDKRPTIVVQMSKRVRITKIGKLPILVRINLTKRRAMLRRDFLKAAFFLGPLGIN